jgi:threonine synthase
MQYHSTNGQVPPTTFEQAVIDGLAKDKGLFMPEAVPALPASFFADLPTLSLGDIARKVARLFIEDEIPEAVLGQIAEEALNFPIPLVSLDSHLHVLELFHGPTLAFKDVGARFMSRVMAHFLRGVDKKVYVLVATSGDTGSAVARSTSPGCCRRASTTSTPTANWRPKWRTRRWCSRCPAATMAT